MTSKIIHKLNPFPVDKNNYFNFMSETKTGLFFGDNTRKTAYEALKDSLNGSTRFPIALSRGKLASLVSDFNIQSDTYNTDRLKFKEKYDEFKKTVNAGLEILGAHRKLLGTKWTLDTIISLDPPSMAKKMQESGKEIQLAELELWRAHVDVKTLYDSLMSAYPGLSAQSVKRFGSQGPGLTEKKFPLFPDEVKKLSDALDAAKSVKALHDFALNVQTTVKTLLERKEPLERYNEVDPVLDSLLAIDSFILNLDKDALKGYYAGMGNEKLGLNKNGELIKQRIGRRQRELEGSISEEQKRLRNSADKLIKRKNELYEYYWWMKGQECVEAGCYDEKEHENYAEEQAAPEKNTYDLTKKSYDATRLRIDEKLEQLERVSTLMDAMSR